MEKTLLCDLKKKMYIRSALISLGSLDKILGLGEGLSPDEILLEIIKQALREFEITCPLIWEYPITRDQLGTCMGREGYGELKSNFTLYLKCMISESQIVLPFNSTPMWRVGGYTSNTYASLGGTTGYPQALAYTYVTHYDRPYIFIGDIASDQFYLRGICSRPIVPDWTTDKCFNPKSETSAIYWMNVEDGGAKGGYFLDLCMVHLLDFIRQLKASISMPTMGIDILANIDAAYQELRGRCDQYALQSGYYGDLTI